MGVLGAGTMGAGIALACALAGCRVVVSDVSEEARSTASERWRLDSAKLVMRGLLTGAIAETVLQNLTLAETVDSFADCSLVIEAVNENLDLKRSLLAKVECVVRQDALLATNTSTLSVAAIASDLLQPARLIGMHFFVPAHLNKLLEIVVQDGIERSTVARVNGWSRLLGKDALICRDTPGFVVNRFYLPFINEAARLVDEGLCSSGEADAAAMEAFDIPIGPFGVCNMGNPKTTLAAVEGLQPLGAFYAPAESLVVHARDGTSWPLSKGAPKGVSNNALIDRLHGAVCFAILDALGQKVAQPYDFDRAASVALRFGVGPVRLMQALGGDAVAALVATFCERYGGDRSRLAAQIRNLTMLSKVERCAAQA